MKYEVVVDAMAPEELPRDEGVGIFVHDSGRAVTLSAEKRETLASFLRTYWGGDEEWIAETVAGADMIGGTVTKTYLDVRYDVTSLSDEQRGHLALYAQAQAEGGNENEYPAVPVEIETNEVEEPTKTILVHLNVTVPVGDDRTADEISNAVRDAFLVGYEGAPPEAGLDEVEVAFVLAEEV